MGAVIYTAQVEAGARVVVFGLGGIGLNVVQACRMALEQRGIAPPYHLLAMSLGAMVATEWARAACAVATPSRVSRRQESQAASEPCC